MRLTSVYNFVELNDRVYTPGWAGEISKDNPLQFQDVPFSDGEDGIIEVTLRNVSPLFTRNGSADRNKSSEYSAHIEMADGKKLYYLPATSLKGMFRSVMEIMTFARLTRSQYTNRFFGYRNFDCKKRNGGTDYVRRMAGVKAGWLHKGKEEKYYLTPCDGDWERIEYSDIERDYPSYKGQKTGWKKNCAIGKVAGMYPKYNKEGKEYRIVCTGDIQTKSKEFLFPAQTLDAIEVGDTVMEKFFTVHDPTPDFVMVKEKGNGSKQSIKDYLESGKDLAVFFLPCKGKGEIEAIGLSSMLRYPYQQSVEDLILHQQKEDDHILDLPRTIFGFTDKEKSLRGRVQFGNAFSDTPLADSELVKWINPKTEKEGPVEGVLGQPKASFYPFYLKQESSPYKTYDDATAIAGRKQYRIHKGDHVADLPQGNGNENTTTSFNPIPAGQVFTLRIAVHNLRKIETGALLSAITLHETKGAWHHLGLAKGFGYGKLEIVAIKLNGLTYEKEEYMRAFEKEMSAFTYPNLWNKTPQLVQLMGILGEHEEDEVKMMELEDYKDARKDANFNPLMERKTARIPTFLDDDDRKDIKQWADALQRKEKEKETERIRVESRRNFERQHKSEYDKAEAYGREKKFDEAIEIYKYLSEQRTFLSQAPTDEENRIKELENEKQAWFKHLKDEFVAQHQKKYDQAQAYHKDGQFSEAINIYGDLISQLREKKLDCINEMQLMQKAVNDQRCQGGLRASLNEKYTGGKNIGEYKVKNFKILQDKIKKWLKDNGGKPLTEEECRIVCETKKRLLTSKEGKMRPMETKELKSWEAILKNMPFVTE